MKPRTEAVAKARELLDQYGDAKRAFSREPHRYVAHHFGKCELRLLLDFIYGGPPTIEEEKLK